MKYYGKWYGNPKGREKDLELCAQEVWIPPAWYGFQCSRKRGHGPNSEYCKQHAKMKANLGDTSLTVSEVKE